MSPDEQALLARPIADLNLSVRARKCMIRLGLSDDRRAGAPHRRRTAGVQELRRHQPERSSREADAKRTEAPRRLISLRIVGRTLGCHAHARVGMFCCRRHRWHAHDKRGHGTRNWKLNADSRDPQ